MEVMVGLEGKDKEGEMKCSPKYGHQGQDATYGDCLVSAHHLRCLQGVDTTNLNWAVIINSQLWHIFLRISR